GVQPPVEFKDEGQEPWLARGAGRALQRVPCGAVKRATADCEPSSPPAVSGCHRPSRHGREEWAGPESVRQHRSWRIVTSSTGDVPRKGVWLRSRARLERCSLFLWTPFSAGGLALRG
ncbi:unnamed protein product, partial [Ectocarpus fasciculatus]